MDCINKSSLDNQRKKRQPFSPQEDAELKKLVETYGDNDWVLISKRICTKRSPRQCRDRWKEYLMPSLNMDPWTKEEDRLLIQKIKECGKKWSIVCMSLKGRSETAAKNRWRLLERRNFNLDYEKSTGNQSKEKKKPNHVVRLIQPAKKAELPKLPSLINSSFNNNEELDKLFRSLPMPQPQPVKYPSLVIGFPLLQLF